MEIMRARTTLFLLALFPTAAMAAEGSPQSRCLDKVERHVQAVRAHMARLDDSADRAQQFSVRYPTAGVYGDAGSIPATGMGYVFAYSFSVPPSDGIYRRELLLLSLRAMDCQLLPRSDEDVEWNTVIVRGGAVRRMKIADNSEAPSPGVHDGQS